MNDYSYTLSFITGLLFIIGILAAHIAITLVQILNVLKGEQVDEKGEVSGKPIKEG